MKPDDSRPPALNGKVTHGDTLLKKAVKELGTIALDGRSTLAIDLKEEPRELIQADWRSLRNQQSKYKE